MSAAQPLTLTQRLDRYRRQGGTELTPRQNRRVRHKLNRKQAQDRAIRSTRWAAYYAGEESP